MLLGLRVADVPSIVSPNELQSTAQYFFQLLNLSLCQRFEIRIERREFKPCEPSRPIKLQINESGLRLATRHFTYGVWIQFKDIFAAMDICFHVCLLPPIPNWIVIRKIINSQPLLTAGANNSFEVCPLIDKLKMWVYVHLDLFPVGSELLKFANRSLVGRNVRQETLCFRNHFEQVVRHIGVCSVR